MKEKISIRKIKCIIVIVGVIIIPLLYSYLYLGAFWDPYSRLESLPVAVVNQDQGAIIQDKQRNLGEEMCDRLKEDGSLKFSFTDEETARTGTEGNDYYAMIVIPEDFSANIASVSTSNKHTATITYSPNEKRNYLASQILSRAVLEIEESTRASVNEEIAKELSNKLREVPEQMTELQDGLDQLADGSTKLSDGADSLAEGTSEFQDKFADYASGISDIQDGANTLSDGITKLDDGISKLENGADTLVDSTAEIDKLTTGAASLAKGAKTFNTSLTQYTAGVDSLITSVNGTSVFLKNYVTNVNPSIMKDPVFAGFISKLSDPTNAKNIQTLQTANTQLKAASKQIADGAETLSSGTTNLPKLKAAIAKLSKGLDTVKTGSSKLEKGSVTLTDGMTKLDDATTKLSDATTKLADGATSLSEGATDLSDGVNDAKSGVNTAIADADSELEALDGISDYAKEPVNVEQSNITSVPNYGTAFAPYFLSLSLWVGALIIFVGTYLDIDHKFKILSRDSEHKVARSFIYLLIGFAQAIVLAIVLKFGLGLKVDNMFCYYASCCLVSMVFMSIVQFLMIHLKDLGKFLTIALLIFQLTSCGGTFPMETVPKLFNVLYPFMPMTYSVGLFKQAISGINQSELVFNIGVLSAILVVFMSLTILFSIFKNKSSERNVEIGTN